MPRILRIHNRLITGGPSLNALYLTKYLSSQFETLLVVGEKEDHEQNAYFLAEQMGIKPILIPDMGRSINPLSDYKAYKKLQKIIRDFKPDIVHTHAAKPGAVGRLAASSLNIPAIVHTYHGHVFHSYFGKLKTRLIINTERFLAKKSHALIAISDKQKSELAEDFHIADGTKFKVIPLGFELKKFSEDQDEKRRKFRREFSLGDNEIAIGIIGRLVPIKNHDLFLEGINYLLSKASKKIKAFIIGDGETRQALEDRARQLNIRFSDDHDPNASLIFTSWRNDIDVINAGLDIIALTSLNEGTPVSLIEAQAANKPIVSTRVGGISDIVLENETALLSETNDIASFQKNLLRLVENEELRNSFNQKGADHVRKKFSVERLASDMSNLYYELLDKEKIKK
ncbi:MAG TPA: glycosyltransferase [Chitinophagaceae bacterium]|jgi:glycosyltransferase involved in cell wall biosynthesis|nr:glycosyltransferase [Chitinophagaceae bacterium]